MILLTGCLKNLPNNNGKVGVWGISYPGFYTTTALLSRHPALVAASPQAPIADLYRDDAFHNGAFMLVANFGFYPGFTNRQDDKPTQRRAKGFNPGTRGWLQVLFGYGQHAQLQRKIL
jgi:predicted acyl esterase